MNKLSFVIVLSVASVVHAQGAPEKKTAAPNAPAADMQKMMMEMSKPGPNQDALKPFAKGGTMSGSEMQPDGKEVATKGKSACKWIDGGMWVACDIEDTSGMGKQAMKWMGHWVFGYDNMAKAYRGYMTDNFGMSSRMKGEVDGAKIVWESMDEIKVPGMPSKERVTEDASDPKARKMTFEGWMGGKWVQTGTATIKTAGGAK